MPIRIGYENLISTIGTNTERPVRGVRRDGMLLPSLDVINQQGKMIPSAGRYRILLTTPNQMQFLIHSQTKPCTWKIECWAWNGFQKENFVVKRTASLYVGDMQSYMIQLLILHNSRFQKGSVLLVMMTLRSVADLAVPQ